ITTTIFTLSLHDALPISEIAWHKTNVVTMLPRYFSNGIGEYKNNNFKAENMYFSADNGNFINEIEKLVVVDMSDPTDPNRSLVRSEEHTSELQSPCNLVC